MTATAFQFIVRRLHAWGVERIFVTASDHALPAGCARGAELPELIECSSGESAALRAAGYAKLSERLGACAVSSEASALQLMAGLYGAWADRLPVIPVVLASKAASASRYQQLDLRLLLRETCAGAAVLPADAEQWPKCVDTAVRMALSKQMPACIVVPSGTEHAIGRWPVARWAGLPRPGGVAWPHLPPGRSELERAARVLNSSNRVAILVGQGAYNAGAELAEVGELLGAGVAKTLSGKDVLPDYLPFVTGTVGPLGAGPSYRMMQSCDALLVVGSTFDEMSSLPPLGQARAVHVDHDATVAGACYPCEVSLVADASAALGALVPLLERKTDRSWRREIEREVAAWWQGTARELSATSLAAELVWQLNAKLPDGAIVSCDSGELAVHCARLLRLRAGQRGVLGAGLPGLRAGLPYALGAKFASPGRPVIALVTDQALLSGGLAGLVSSAHHCRTWRDPRFVVAVVRTSPSNGEQPGRCNLNVASADYKDLAASLGLHAEEVTKAEEVGRAWQRALAASKPAVIDVCPSHERVHGTSACGGASTERPERHWAKEAGPPRSKSPA